MVWAIDLDNSTLTKALSENIARLKPPMYTPKYYSECGERIEL
jgi:chitinase